MSETKEQKLWLILWLDQQEQRVAIMKTVEASSKLEAVTKLSAEKLFIEDIAFSGNFEFFGVDDSDDSDDFDNNEELQISKMTKICQENPQKILDYFEWTVKEERFPAFGIMDGAYKEIINLIEYR